MSWLDNKNVYIERDAAKRLQLVHHVTYPFTHDSDDVNGLAVAYLGELHKSLGLKKKQIAFLKASVSEVDDRGNGPASDGSGPQLRWRSRTRLRDETTVIMIQQTHDAGLSRGQIDVEGSGIRIMVHYARGMPRITGMASTLRESFSFPARRTGRGVQVFPTAADQAGTRAGMVRLYPHRINTIHARFGLPTFPLEPDSARAPVEAHRLIHQHQPARFQSGPDLLPGSDYVAVAFRLPPGATTRMPHTGEAERRGSGHIWPACELLVREEDDAPLVARALIAHAESAEARTGLVFVTDPLTRTGKFALRPTAQQDVLDEHRQEMVLPALLPPSASGDPWRLSGPHAVVDGNDSLAPIPCAGLGICPPEAATKNGFHFPSRTNEFAAVNAYYHCATMFSRLEEYGLPFESFPMRYALPARIVHRATIQPGPCSDGLCIDAQVLIIPGDVESASRSRIQFRFALADLTLNPGSVGCPLSPLGIACDVRIVWHEFCHALIAGATDQLEFPFAHSAGDALAAIACDPGSKLAEGDLESKFRGLTFPWVAGLNRRHDRRAQDGWSWSGPLGEVQDYTSDIHDFSGYAREQVLSSTLFRFYRAIGGDAATPTGEPDLSRRRAASDYAIYLIVRAIASLGPAVTVPAVNARAFASALMDADAGTKRLGTREQTAISPEGRIGGAVWKVVRWAFEKQGLCADPASPRDDGSGEPDPVDVFIEDAAGRGGEYGFVTEWHAAPGSVWSRQQMDEKTAHEAPRAGQVNYVYVQVKNRGSRDATDITVCVRVAPFAAAHVWPSAHWTELHLAAKGVNGAGTLVNGRGAVILGPFEWTPEKSGAYSILVSADAEGDRSNINPDAMLACSFLPSRLDQLIPFDNNLALAVWTV